MPKIIAALIYDYNIGFWTEEERYGWGRGYLKLFPPSAIKGLTISVRPTEMGEALCTSSPEEGKRLCDII